MSRIDYIENISKFCKLQINGIDDLKHYFKYIIDNCNVEIHKDYDVIYWISKEYDEEFKVCIPDGELERTKEVVMSINLHNHDYINDDSDNYCVYISYDKMWNQIKETYDVSNNYLLHFLKTEFEKLIRMPILWENDDYSYEIHSRTFYFKFVDKKMNVRNIVN